MIASICGRSSRACTAAGSSSAGAPSKAMSRSRGERLVAEPLVGGGGPAGARPRREHGAAGHADEEDQQEARPPASPELRPGVVPHGSHGTIRPRCADVGQWCRLPRAGVCYHPVPGGARGWGRCRTGAGRCWRAPSWGATPTARRAPGRVARGRRGAGRDGGRPGSARAGWSASWRRGRRRTAAWCWPDAAAPPGRTRPCDRGAKRCSPRPGPGGGRPPTSTPFVPGAGAGGARVGRGGRRRLGPRARRGGAAAAVVVGHAERHHPAGGGGPAVGRPGVARRARVRGRQPRRRAACSWWRRSATARPGAGDRPRRRPDRPTGRRAGAPRAAHRRRGAGRRPLVPRRRRPARRRPAPR